MNILLVDDDEYIIQAIKQKINWKQYNIENIYSANNIRQAKELLVDATISIMICDIEMPQGSGLDLLEWIREQNYSVQTIFLTSYAQFEYAQRAIELKSLNYYLKPINYEQLQYGISEAVEAAKKQLQQTTYQKESEYWKKNKAIMIRNLFRDFFIHDTQQSVSSMLEKIQQTDLSYQIDSKFIPTWMELYDNQNTLKKWEQAQLLLVIESAIKETCKHLDIRDIKVIPIHSIAFCILIELTQEEISFLTLQNLFESVMIEYKKKLNVDSFFGIGSICTLETLRENVSSLQKMAMDNVTHVSNVISIIEYENRELNYHLPAITAWETLLKSNHAAEFLDNVQSYLQDLAACDELNQEILKLFRLDMMQLMYAVLKPTEVQTYKLIINDTGEQLYQKSIQSVQDMMNYVQYIAQITITYSNFAQKPKSVVDKIKDYIDKNYIKEISRNDLVEIVYLNPDYISRLFKKETGVSISTYLIQKRMSVAKELLANTNMPVNVVSMHVGYSSFSYFTKIFRENTGLAPNEYRKKRN